MASSRIVKELTELAEKAVELAMSRGADAAEVLVRDGSELTAKVRLGEPELVQEAGSRGLGIRVFKDSRQATTYTSDMRAPELARLVAESVELAELAEPDEHSGLPDPADLAGAVPDLELYDPAAEGLDAGTAIAKAIAGEKAALAADKRVTNSEGASYSRVLGAVAFATSGGFSGGYRGSYTSFFVEPVCDDADDKKRNGYYWTAARFVDQLEAPEAVGLEAARRTLAKLGSRKVETCDCPVVFDPDAGRAIIGQLFSVANGSSFYRKSSYLVDREGTEVASKLVTITDDPLIPRGPGSRPFDGDGLATRKNTLVAEGVLETILCDTYSARRLGRASTGSAGRSVGGTPSPTTSNLILSPGTTSRDDLIAATERGLLVTGMMGFGFNPVTGDFSRGAEGFWIENGEVTFPVSEVTISANFDDLLTRIDLLADDLDTRSSTQVPTFRVAQMTLAGK
jgi:PmbA protein